VLDLIQRAFATLYNVPLLISYVGLAGMALIVFAETGLFFGFFLPGDSLLVTAGIFAARGDFDIVTLNVVLIVAAIAGDATGFWSGKRAGQALYSRPDSRFFKRKHLETTRDFYARHGGKTIVIARFMPIVRTFAPIVAGAASMPYTRFALYNVFGAIVWVTSLTLGGYWLGSLIPDIDSKIHLVVAVVIALSFLPALVSWLRSRRQPAG
jgi:membrane-associated protein